jgi:hypothetical protein
MRKYFMYKLEVSKVLIMGTLKAEKSRKLIKQKSRCV